MTFVGQRGVTAGGMGRLVHSRNLLILKLLWQFPPPRSDDAREQTDSIDGGFVVFRVRRF